MKIVNNLSNFNTIEQKLSAFIKKYYTSLLLKGLILFIAIGLLYFIATLLIEHFLWLSPIYRTILFWLFISVEIGLLYKFIGVPLLKLSGIKKGISKDVASVIIGNHFPEVSDKLINLLQLKKESKASELLEASIDQKAKSLQPIPFKLAINFSTNKKYIKYLALPLLIFLLFQITGNQNIIGDSYTRVMNPSVAYTPPAPFHFIIKNTNLQAIENKPFVLQISTKGKVAPTDIKIQYNKETYYLNPTGINSFKYEFSNLKEAVQFSLNANEVSSQEYTIDVLKVPSITHFSMELDYPDYVGKKDETINNTGNAVVPEGTKINWKLITKATDNIQFKTKDTIISLVKNDAHFSHVNKVFKFLNYELTTHNKEVANYEQLAYKIEVVKDEYPEIQVQSRIDSLDNQIIYFLGKISDDYGLKKLQLVYNQIDSNVKERILLPISKGNFDQFSYVFPNQLNLEKGKAYEYYFEVSDNDIIHGYKKSKSELFTYNKLSDSELEQQQLEQQQQTIDNLDKTLDKLEKQEKSLEDLNQLNKEKNKLNWNDKNKMKQFLQRQEQQEQLMKKFNKDLQKNLEDFQKENITPDPFKEELQKRLGKNEELEKKEKLLEELKKLQDKIKQEDLAKKIDKLSKQNKNDQKSLEQILELTKRYYISKKFEKIANDLEELAKEQEELSEKSKEENTKEKQDELNKKFSDLQKEMEDINKENEELQQPMKLEDEKQLQEEINKDQQKASDNLDKKKQEKAKDKQKDAAKKMQEMSMKMQQQMQSSSEEQEEEDVKMLRQILDNLIHYSFDQENLLETFKDINASSLDFPSKLKKQYILKENFKHIDDSLFALSLRQPKIAEVITKEITDVHFNIDKSLERFSDLKIYLGRSNQQYALTAANNLANLLSDVLKQMQNDMNMPGLGQCDKPGGKGFQLSDIIKEQESLMKKMSKGSKGKDGKPNKPGESGEPKDGKGDKQGNNPGDKPGGQQGQGSDGEENSEMLFEIYKKQQELKNKLSYLLEKNGLDGKMNNLLNKMDKIQDDLLEKGFSDEVVQQMQQLKHELLKLDKAAFEQGQDNKREANTSKQQFNNNSQLSIPKIEQYFKEVEILNRQALPLQPVYKKKVKEYFNNATD